MSSSEEAFLWNNIQLQCLDAKMMFRSDLFTLLQTILAYYKVRGTEPVQMIDNERIAFYIEQAKDVAE